MKNRYLLFSIIVLLNISCQDKIEPQESFFMKFYPRKANYVWVDYSRLVDISYNDQTGFTEEDIYDDKCKIGDFRLKIFTSNIDTLQEYGFSAISGPYYAHQQLDEVYQDLDEHNVALEKQLEDDLRSTLKSTLESKKENDDLLPWEYRTTGISELIITCNKPIFNKESGASLNSFFHIVSLDPHQIISNDTKELIFGSSDILNKMSIEEWLDMNPMAQPSLGLSMNYVPNELPGDFSFTVRITTIDGVEIENSGREIQLLP